MYGGIESLALYILRGSKGVQQRLEDIEAERSNDPQRAFLVRTINSDDELRPKFASILKCSN